MASLRPALRGIRSARPGTPPSREWRRRSEAWRRRELERAFRQSGDRAAHVVARRRNVVRPVRVKDRREHLDLPPAGPELVLAAAVERDAFARARVVEVEEPPHRAEP